VGLVHGVDAHSFFVHPRRLEFPCVVEPRHRLLGGICQAGRGRRNIAGWLVRHNGVRNHRMVRVDGDVLHDDLLLPSTSLDIL
jgi:hypothetical protein